MNRLLLYSCLLCFLCFVSCEKDELTIPAEVNFEFAMESYHSGTSVKSGQAFDIDEGTIFVNAVEFDGRRDQGEDYFFTSNFETPLHAEMHTGYMNQNVTFDIPQGVYNRIELIFSIGNDEDEGLCLRGKFQQGPVEEIPVVFEYNFQEQIRVRAKNKNGYEQIVLKKDTPSTATVVCDASFLFRMVNIGMIQSAERIQMEGEEIILINNENNTNIFGLLVTRLDNSMRVIFE